jgi:hypothetical protein
MSEERQIDWSSASVEPTGKLTVALSGECDKRWREVFNSVAVVLARKGHVQLWGEIAAEARGGADLIVVEELDLDAPDHVDRLREQLDALLAQANATVADEREPDAAGEDESAEDPRKRAAVAATEAFRALAGEPRSDAPGD